VETTVAPYLYLTDSTPPLRPNVLQACAVPQPPIVCGNCHVNLEMVSHTRPKKPLLGSLANNPPHILISFAALLLASFHPPLKSPISQESIIKNSPLGSVYFNGLFRQYVYQ
jgi:hypothetical protein